VNGIDGAHWRLQVDVPTSRGVSRELAELQLPGEKVAGEGKAAMVALMTALPFGVAAGWMLLVAKSSQRRGTLLPSVGAATTASLPTLKSNHVKAWAWSTALVQRGCSQHLLAEHESTTTQP